MLGKGSKFKKTKKGVQPEKDDLVLIKSDNLGITGRYGVVQKIESPQTLVLKVRGGDEVIRTIGQTIPLVCRRRIDNNFHVSENKKFLV